MVPSWQPMAMQWYLANTHAIPTTTNAIPRMSQHHLTNTSNTTPVHAFHTHIHPSTTNIHNHHPNTTNAHSLQQIQIQQQQQQLQTPPHLTPTTGHPYYTLQTLMVIVVIN